MGEWRHNQILEALGGPVVYHPPQIQQKTTGVAIDSREIKPGWMFICIVGENQDGHKFIPGAIEQGATCVLVENAALSDGRVDPDRYDGVVFYGVEDTLLALQDLARYRRNLIQGTVIGVTGSNGKTSTRDMIASLAKECGASVYATSGNLNNHYGLPLTIVRAPLDRELYVFEMGMNHPGEICLLSRIARPDLSIITSISQAHIEFFDDLHGIAKAKLEILEGMKSGGTLLYLDRAIDGGLARELATQKGVAIKYFGFENGQVQEPFFGPGKVRFRWNEWAVENRYYHGRGMAENLLGSISILKEAGFSPRLIAEAVPAIRPSIARRFEIHELGREGQKLGLIDDSYNANTASFINALESTKTLYPDGNLGFAMGEMAELGSKHSMDAHIQVAKRAANLGYRLMIGCGQKSVPIALQAFQEASSGKIEARAYDSVDSLLEKKEEAFEIIKGLDAFLVKGSRSARMDRLSDAIKDYFHV